MLPMGVPQDISADLEIDSIENIESLVEEKEETVIQETQNTDVLEFVEEEQKEDFLQEKTIEKIEEDDLEELLETTEELPEETILVDSTEDDLLTEKNTEIDDLLTQDESPEEIVLTHDEDHIVLNHDEDIDILSHDENDFILEEHTEETAPVQVEEVKTEKKAYDFSLETEVDENPIEEELLPEVVSEQDNNEIQLEEELEEMIYPMSTQEPVELVYDEEEKTEESSFVANEQENKTLEQDSENSIETENVSELEIQPELTEPVVQEPEAENVANVEDTTQNNLQETNQDSQDNEIQQLLDDDLLALLTDDTSTTVTTQASQEEVSQEETPVFENNQDEVGSEEYPIETLYEESQAQENGEQKEFELAQEPVSAKTVSATKRLLVLLAMLFLIAGGGAGMWFVNNAKNQADNYNDGINQDAEIFDMQDKINDSETPAISQDINKSMANSFSEKPAAITITKLSWQISEKLAADDSVKEYLQTAGKNIQMNLQNDLANSADVNFNNTVKVSFEITQENELKGIQVLESSGSDQIDDIIVRGIKNTLKYVNVPKVKDYDSDYFLTLIINF